MILIDAIYLNTGGGKILLEYFIDNLLSRNLVKNYFFLFDSRLELKQIEKLHVNNYLFLKSSEKNRKIFYKNHINLFTNIFCFANVPPPVNIRKKIVHIYFHNVLLLESINSNLTLKNKLILLLKRYYIKSLNKDYYQWIVQTSLISNTLSNRIKINNKCIKVIPIFNINNFQNCNYAKTDNYKNYLYVADSCKHKNHNLLLDAWELFAKNVSVSLNLTLPKDTSKELLNKIRNMKIRGYNITNHGVCTREELKSLYTNCNFLVFPSIAESFGLPLIEAASAGCKVIASDLQYVHEVIVPSLVFNPYDIHSIYLALSQSLDYDNIKNTTLLAENQINHLLNTISYVSK